MTKQKIIEINDVVWADATHDNSRQCDLCLVHTCNMPSHLSRERYTVKLNKEARAWEKENPVI